MDDDESGALKTFVPLAHEVQYNHVVGHDENITVAGATHEEVIRKEVICRLASGGRPCQVIGGKLIRFLVERTPII